MTLRAPEFAYVTGGSSSVVHRQAIARGGFGEVHEVRIQACVPLTVALRCPHATGTRPSSPKCLLTVSKIFARKLLDVRGLRREVIRTEEEAIKKVCGKGGHRNVITVLWLGDISGTEFYGIDMELCGLNLELFIHRKTYPTPSESVPFYFKDGQPPLREQQVWNVMKQLADGVKYIHSLKVVHRDLKPANSKFRLGLATDETVLYSRKDSCWKLADFGFASEGNSSTLRRSNDVRGTTGYRAPELLANGNATFNNKADIWSLGCILFELSVGRRPFFHDYATAAYGTANDDMIVELDDSFSCECKRTLASTIISMLKSCPKSRPSAIQLLKDFNRYIKDTKNAQKQSPAIDNVERTGPMRLNSSLQARGTFLF